MSHSDFFVFAIAVIFFVTSNMIFCEVKKTGVRAVRAVRRLFFFFYDPDTDEIYALALHDAQNLYLF